MKKQFDIKKLVLLNLPYLLMGLFATNFGEAWRLAQGANASEKFLSLFAVLPGALQSFWPSLHPLDLLVGLCCGAGLRLAVYLKSKNAKKYRHGMEYGSARWGIREDISEPIAPATAERLKRGMKGGNKYGKPVPGQPQPQSINRPREHGEIKDSDINPLRNKRDVWKINTVPFKGGHYAAYPPKLVETCLLAGCPEGGIVLDPFMGSGTTGMVASQMGRHFVGIELNPAYTELAYKRIGGEI